MKKIKIFINGNLSINSTQAQDRDGKHYAKFLNQEKYEIYAFSSDSSIDEILANNNNIHYFIATSKLSLLIKSLFILLFNRINIYISGKAFWPEFIIFFINKFVNRGKNILILVNQIPYLWTKFDLVIFDKIVKHSHSIISISKKVAESFENRYNFSTTIINLFYNTPKFNQPKLNHTRKKIVAVGSMTCRKSPFIFSDLSKKMPEYDFYWIGQGYYYQWIELKKKEEALENLYLIPILLQKELFNFLQNCDLFYFPSVHEGFPNVLVEAMCCGLPIICYHSYGPEAVIHNVNGIVLDNFFDSKDAINGILLNEEKHDEFSKNSIKIAQKYNGKMLVSKLERLINDLL